MRSYVSLRVPSIPASVAPPADPNADIVVAEWLSAYLSSLVSNAQIYRLKLPGDEIAGFSQVWKEAVSQSFFLTVSLVLPDQRSTIRSSLHGNGARLARVEARNCTLRCSW